MKKELNEVTLTERKNLHFYGNYAPFMEQPISNKFSIVIVAKNAADKITRLLESVKGLSDDVIVCDTGSTDDTRNIIRSFGANLFEIPWKGYGISKNQAIGFARYDWILSLDSDEKIDEALYQQLRNWKEPEDPRIVYTMKWKNFLGAEWIKHCHWGANWKKRLFNKHVVSWDDAIAHEDVCSMEKMTFVRLDGFLEHYSFKNKQEYASKMAHSAMITAEKYHNHKKKSTWIQLVFSPVYTYVKVLIFNLGFMDGRSGLLIAKTSANYTYLKYSRLRLLNQQLEEEPVRENGKLTPVMQ